MSVEFRGGELVLRPLTPAVTSVSLLFDKVAQLSNTVIYATRFRLQVGARLGGFNVAEYCVLGKAKNAVIMLTKAGNICD